MTILSIPAEFFNNIFQGLFGKKEVTAQVTMGQSHPLPMSDEEYFTAIEPNSIDLNDLYKFQLMM